MPEEDELEIGVAALLTSVMRLQLAERRIEGRIAAEHGLSQSDVLALALLVRNQKRPVGQIALDLALTPGSASLLVTRLVKAGFAARVPSETDRRSVLIEATEQGIAAVRAVRDQYADAIRASAGAVSSRCIQTAARVVRETAEHLDEGGEVRHPLEAAAG